MSAAENFIGGYHFAIEWTPARWTHRHIDELPADPDRDWPDMLGCAYHQVDRAMEMEETYDGSGSWKPDLSALRDKKWAATKQHREALAEDGCMTPLGRVDTDQDSQRKINGAVTGALIAQLTGSPFAIDWTMADNSVVPHDKAQMIAMGVSVLAFIDACQAAGTAIREALDAAVVADDAAALETVDLTAFPDPEVLLP